MITWIRLRNCFAQIQHSNVIISSQGANGKSLTGTVFTIGALFKPLEIKTRMSCFACLSPSAT